MWSYITGTQHHGEFMSIKFSFDKTRLTNVMDFVGSDRYVKVGVLAMSPARRNEESKKWNTKKKKPIDAVALAAVHEFGSPSRKIPKRSFLQKTQFNFKDQWRSDFAAHKAEAMQQIADGQIELFLHDVGKKWVNWVHDTFDAEGPGWDQLSKRRKKERQITGHAAGNKDPENWPILQDTTQMKRSIIYEVV